MAKLAGLVLLLLVLHSCQSWQEPADLNEYQLSNGEHVECFRHEATDCGLLLAECGPTFDTVYDCQQGAVYLGSIDTD